jgi:cobalt/nickel transport system permease protein
VHHVTVERWSRGSSPLHARDARAKLVVLLVFLVAVATTPPSRYGAFGGYAVLLAIAIASAALPPGAMLRRAALVLPFSAIFALLTWWTGEPARAFAMAAKSFLSGLAALVLIGTTPLPQLMRALEWFRVPRPLILVVQFLFRYLFVIAEQAQRMLLAARSRQGSGQARHARFHAAAGALGVLFVKSFERADGIYRAMISRAFTGHFPILAPARFSGADTAFVCAAAALSTGVRLAL